MYKKKVLSIVLSLAMVFSMTMAFTLTSNADDTGSLLSGSSTKAVTSVTVNGIELENGKYIKADSQSAQTGTPTGTGYACFKDGKLYLNNFVLTEIKEHSAISCDQLQLGTLYIVLEGTNKLEMSNVQTGEESPHNRPAMELYNCNLVITGKDNNASLELTSFRGYAVWDEKKYYPVDCISAADFEMKSGKLIINASPTNEYGDIGQIYDCGINLSGYALLSGGTLDIESAGVGIKTKGAVTVNGGEIVCGKENENTNGCGIYAMDSVFINGGTFTAQGRFEAIPQAIRSDKSIIVSGGQINCIEKPSQSIRAESDIIVFGGEINIEGTDGVGGISAGRDFYLYDGNISIKNNHFSGISAEYDVNILGGKIIVETNNHGGLESSYGNIKISNAVIIAKIGHIWYSISALNGDVSITNSNVNIDSKNVGISAKNLSIKNSDVEVSIPEYVDEYSAIQATLKLYGSPAVYAGAKAETAQRVSAGSDLSKYDYVHIYKGSNVFTSKVAASIKTFFVTLLANRSGSSILKTTLWQALSKIFALI